MRPLPTISVVLIVVVLSVTVLTGTVVGDHAEETDWLVLSPHSGPNGQYASIDEDGHLRVDLGDGLNANAVITFDDVFNISNHGPQDIEVWITHDATNTIEFQTDGGDSIEGAKNAIMISPGETVVVGVIVDTHGISSETDLIDEMIVHAQRAGPTPSTRRPKGTESGGDSDPMATEPTGTLVSQGVVRIQFDSEIRSDEHVRIERRDDLPADPAGRSLRAGATRVDEISRTGNESAATDVRLRELDIDTAVTPGEQFVLSGTESRFPSEVAIDPRRRIAVVYDITPPQRLEDRPATIWLTFDRVQLDGADPSDARLARRTDAGWQLLATVPTLVNGSHVEVRSRTPGLSTFALFSKPEAQFRWTFEGHGTTQGMHVSLRYDEPGIYDGTLEVSDTQGRSDTESYRVLVNDRPSVRIERPEAIEADQPVTLRANVSDEFGHTSVTWTFDDGTTETGTSVNRSFDRGEHAATVRVEDEFGASDEADTQFVAGSRDPLVQLVRFTLGVEGRLALVALVLLVVFGAFRWYQGRRPVRDRRSSR